MPKMTIRIILKSGVVFDVKCTEFTLTRNGFGIVVKYDIKGITENQPIYIDLEQVAAIVRTLLEEGTENEQDAVILFRPCL